MATSEMQTTKEGTEFTVTGSRVVFPTPDHEMGGGVAITDEAATKIMAFPDDGKREKEQLSWEWTGETQETRIGESKVLQITQTSFGRERTTEKTLVDVADADLLAKQ